MTVIGTSTNLLISGLVIDEAAHDRRVQGGIGFFEPGYIGEESRRAGRKGWWEWKDPCLRYRFEDLGGERVPDYPGFSLFQFFP